MIVVILVVHHLNWRNSSTDLPFKFVCHHKLELLVVQCVVEYYVKCLQEGDAEDQLIEPVSALVGRDLNDASF